MCVNVTQVWEGSTTIVPARLSVLEVCRSWRNGRLQPITNQEPGHQMVNLPSVGGLIPTRDAPNEGTWCRPRTSGAWQTDDWVCRRLCTGSRVEGERCSLEGNRCSWPRSLRHVSPASRAASCWTGSLRSTCRRSQACSAGRELVLQRSRDDCVESRPDIQKGDPRIGSWGVQVLEDEVEDDVDGIVYRPVGSVTTRSLHTTTSPNPTHTTEDEEMSPWKLNRWCSRALLCWRSSHSRRLN